jgi:uncharacterized protein (TIGR02147 family)
MDESMDIIESTAPDIFNYLDYRSFLKDRIAYLQSKNKKYSQRWIAKKAGFKSPQLISMILSGQRSLSSTNAQLLSLALDLSDKEEEYFLLTVDLAHLDNSEKQMELVAKIKTHFKNGLFKEISDEGLEYIRKWYYPAFREMVALKNYNDSAETSAEALGLTVEQIQEARNLLLELKYLELKDGKLQRTQPSLHAPNFVSPVVMAHYHLQMLEKSFNALSLAREHRYFDNLTIAVPKKLLPEMHEMIRRWIRELDLLAESYPQKDEVYQLNLQFFSLTQGRLNEK